MPIITWEEKFSVGNDIIDEQHKKLLDLVNQLFDSMRQGQSKEILGELLDSLVDYTVYHFAEEETAMRKAEYSKLAAHIKIHESFIKKISDFQSEYKSGNSYISLDIITFLKDWILNHILVQDTKYKSVI